MKALCSRGARLVRLDAFGYATKKRGTSCFFEVYLVFALNAEAEAPKHGLPTQKDVSGDWVLFACHALALLGRVHLGCC